MRETFAGNENSQSLQRPRKLKSIKFDENKMSKSAIESVSTTKSVKLRDLRRTVAVHCKSGLGRSSTLIALALIGQARMQPMDAIQYLRDVRGKGALNMKQVNFLMKFKPQRGER